jgi:tetratricopeptide (TPR) repeat protein
MIRRTVLSLVLLAAVSAAQAQALKDPQWQVWLDAGQTDALEKAAQSRLAAHPDDSQALAALALAMSDRLDNARLEAGQNAAETCIARHTDQAVCFYALGSVQGIQALAGGAMKAISMAGKVKSNLTRALELDPTLFEARRGLVQFYLLVPGMVGGSTSKARDLAAAVQASQPEQAKLLRALVAAKDKNWVEEERELRSIKPGGDDKPLKSAVREAWGQLGTDLMWAQQADKARDIFVGVQRDWPRHALGFYGLGRVEAQATRYDEAIRLYEKAATLDGADKLPIDHRLGQALVDKGDKAEGRRALERFVANKRSNPANVKDARKLLDALGQG